MHRTEMYLREDQLDALRSCAFVLTRKEKKRIAVSEIVRSAVDFWLEKHKAKLSETDLILSSPDLIQDIRAAVKDLSRGRVLTRREALGR